MRLRGLRRPGGNLTSDGCQNYSFDREGDGHLLASSSVQPPPSTCSSDNDYLGFAQTYTYDPFGRRYAVTGDGYTTIYPHDDLDHEIAEYDGSGTLWQDNVFDPHDRAPVAENS